MGKQETIQQARRRVKATKDMFVVKRDGEGNVVPIDREIEWEGDLITVEVRPMSYGDIEAWNKKADGEDRVGPEEIAKVLAKHMASPDLSSLTAPEMKREFKAMAVGRLLMAVMGASGMEGTVEVAEDMSAKVTMEEDEGNS